MSDQTAAITHHEAGHAVAALMTVNNQLDDQLTVTVTLIDGCRGTGNGDLLVSGDHPVQAAFIFYAGPWAEVRVQWGKPLHTLDDTNDHGMSFRRMVKAAFNDASHFGGGSDGARFATLAHDDPSIPENEPYWSGELERAWPIIARLAGALRDRLKIAEAEPGPYAELNPNRTMHRTSMPNREVVALVQLELEQRGMWHYLT